MVNREMTCFGIFVPQDPAMHVDALHAFADGLRERQIPFEFYALEEGYRRCDCAVTFGVAKWKTPRGRLVGDMLAEHNKASPRKQHLVVERGFIHRDRYYMIGWGGLNGRANFLNHHSPADRWHQLNVDVAPWRTSGEHIVLCGQVPWDASVQHVDHREWCRHTAKMLRKWSARPIVFRPHPLAKDAIDMDGTEIDVVLSQNENLRDDLHNAWAVVTFSSNAGVEATLAGIPAFVGDKGAMGFSLLNKNLRYIESPRTPDRTQWLNDLAYTQWTLEEMADGLPIQHLWENRLPLSSRIKLALRRIYGEHPDAERGAA